jgi:hypothetical protein
MKKLTQGMAEHNKAMAAAKSDEAKNSIVSLFSGDPGHGGAFLSPFILHIFHIMCRKLKSRIQPLGCGRVITFWQ